MMNVHSGMGLAAVEHTFELGLPTWRSRSEGLLAVSLAAIRAVPSRRGCCSSSMLSICAPSMRCRLYMCHYGMLCAAWTASEVVRLGEATSTSEMLHYKHPPLSDKRPSLLLWYCCLTAKVLNG